MNIYRGRDALCLYGAKDKSWLVSLAAFSPVLIILLQYEASFFIVLEIIKKKFGKSDNSTQHIIEIMRNSSSGKLTDSIKFFASDYS